MPTASAPQARSAAQQLPSDPDVEQLRKQAKDLRDGARRGDPRAVDLIAEFDPAVSARTYSNLPLHLAQRVLAKLYGFTSWTALVRHVEVVQQLSWKPAIDDRADESDADRFLRLACLNYDSDDAGRREQARQLLSDKPDLLRDNIFAAAACAEADQINSMLSIDPSAANADGGPYGWPPLMYLCYARHDLTPDVDAVLRSAGALLAAGADPNAGRLWHGLPTPFTLLTGVFGSGEQGGVAQPAHPYAYDLAELLLEAGADANDGQTLYNRMFDLGDSHLRLLLDYGLGHGDGGPWRQKLGAVVDTPVELVAQQLQWAIVHDQRDRVRLLVDAEVIDVTAELDRSHGLPAGRGRNYRPVDLAVLNGNLEIAAYLTASGGGGTALDGPDRVIAAAFAGDAEAVATASAADRRAAIARRPGAIVWATANHRARTVELLAGAGFNVNALGRADTMIEQKWETALHSAAGNGDLPLIELLLRLGADRTLLDKRFKATPAQWADVFGQRDVAERLSR